MLFNSFEFIFLFLPITAVLYFLLMRYRSHEYGLGLLVLASLFFYAWWNPVYVLLILFSIGMNYVFGSSLIPRSGRNGKGLLVVGVSANLGLLAYFKYANFFVDNLNLVTGASWNFEKIGSRSVTRLAYPC